MYQSIGMYQSNPIQYARQNVAPSPLEYIAYSAQSTRPAQSSGYQSNSAIPILISSKVDYQPFTTFVESMYNIFQPRPAGPYSGGAMYVPAPRNQMYGLFETRQEYHFIPDNFLKPGKEGIFVGRAEEIKEHIQEAFQKVMGEPFPNHIKISICNEKEFRKLAPSPATIGLSINRSQHGLLSEIFVLNDYLGRVMLTLGHELGHVLTAPLDTTQDEEAKAYAFSLAWMEVIKKHNIANLREAIVLENPAHNGLHDVAFDFVIEQKKNKDAWEIYLELCEKELCVT